jgi:hypothetical protein
VHASLPHFVVLLVSVRFQSFDANILLKYIMIDYDLDYGTEKSHSMVQGRMLSGYQ